ncbi:glycine oxidase ThiO [Lichenihabitans psoromatis]|uniref:glycine oxidase ThiO n=1 Tax=Lichenihabitans psoromatis TaxID=2528642 RepID=UPI00103850C3|nr:glycine oxidase ThiO [Lichenihabitans psoromatis]
MRVIVVGAGVAGLVTAVQLAERGASVDVVDRGAYLGAASCSWFAGGMLAPWCEAESAEPAVTHLGQMALDWWPAHIAGTVALGTLVVAPPRDTAELSRFSKRTTDFEWLDQDAVARLEPDLDGRFRKALFFPQEAHLDPRRALVALAARLEQMGVRISFDRDVSIPDLDADRIVDCRGFAAAADLPDLRGVKGEMVVIRTHEIKLHRPIRMLHPRIPLYIVPRQDGLFMIGATSIESADRSRITARSMIELLSAAYALHPAFGEAEVVEIGTDVRPAFPDNLPAIRRDGKIVRLNGLYRHGFLLSPAFARMAADAVFEETDGADRVER